VRATRWILLHSGFKMRGYHCWVRKRCEEDGCRVKVLVEGDRRRFVQLIVKHRR